MSNVATAQSQHVGDDYVVKDISLAAWGRKEISLAETEIDRCGTERASARSSPAMLRTSAV